MSTDLSDTLVVGIAATALFDLREADAFFQAQRASDPATALQGYRHHMLERKQEPLADGTAMPLVRALLGRNRFQSEGDSRTPATAESGVAATTGVEPRKHWGSGRSAGGCTEGEKRVKAARGRGAARRAEVNPQLMPCSSTRVESTWVLPLFQFRSSSR